MFVFCFYFCYGFFNVHAKLLSVLFKAQLKAIINIFQHCSIYLLGFFETRPDQVTLVPLGAISFGGLMGADELMSFDKLAVCGCATLSGNLVVVGIILS